MTNAKAPAIAAMTSAARPMIVSIPYQPHTSTVLPDRNERDDLRPFCSAVDNLRHLHTSPEYFRHPLVAKNHAALLAA
jgi:hypothetical protein